MTHDQRPMTHLASAVLAGLLASGLFLVVFGASLGFVFMFVPTLPLFFLGLSPRSNSLPAAIVLAGALITLVAGLASGILFIIFLALPSWYFSSRALHAAHLPGSEERLWYPIGLILMHLSLYASCLIALVTWYYSDLPGGLPQLISQNVHDAFADMESDYGDIIDQMAGMWSFLMFPITLWLWGILLYGHAWIANRMLAAKSRQVRPDLAVTLFAIPAWMLHLIAICALATLIGGPSMSFLGKAALLTLLLPYFFLGCAIMHQSVRHWPNAATTGRFFIGFVYFLTFSRFWPVLILAGVGLAHQIKYLRASGSWFRN